LPVCWYCQHYELHTKKLVYCTGSRSQYPWPVTDLWTFVTRIVSSYLPPLLFPSCPEFSSCVCMLEILTLILPAWKIHQNFVSAMGSKFCSGNLVGRVGVPWLLSWSLVIIFSWGLVLRQCQGNFISVCMRQVIAWSVLCYVCWSVLYIIVLIVSYWVMLCYNIRFSYLYIISLLCAYPSICGAQYIYSAERKCGAVLIHHISRHTLERIVFEGKRNVDIVNIRHVYSRNKKRALWRSLNPTNWYHHHFRLHCVCGCMRGSWI
jgi:hypothetical protein